MSSTAQTFTIASSASHVFDYGTFFLSKLVHESIDDLLGLKSQITYYVWGSKQLSGTVDLVIDDYVIEAREFVVPMTDSTGKPNDNAGEIITLKYIKAKK